MVNRFMRPFSGHNTGFEFQLVDSFSAVHIVGTPDHDPKVAVPYQVHGHGIWHSDGNAVATLIPRVVNSGAHITYTLVMAGGSYVRFIDVLDFTNITKFHACIVDEAPNVSSIGILSIEPRTGGTVIATKLAQCYVEPCYGSVWKPVQRSVMMVFGPDLSQKVLLSHGHDWYYEMVPGTRSVKAVRFGIISPRPGVKSVFLDIVEVSSARWTIPLWSNYPGTMHAYVVVHTRIEGGRRKSVKARDAIFFAAD